jgi:hypothetical protein
LRREIDSANIDQFPNLFIAKTLAEICDQVFLAMLPENHAIQHQRSLKTHLLQDLSAVRKSRNISFDLRIAFGKDPKRIKIILFGWTTLPSMFEHRGPRIAERNISCMATELVRDILPQCVPLVPMDTTFSLLKIHRVRRQIPMHNRVAIGMEVQPFLA